MDSPHQQIELDQPMEFLSPISDTIAQPAQPQKRKRAYSETLTEPTPKRPSGTPPRTPPPFTIHTTRFLRDQDNIPSPPLPPSLCTEALQRKNAQTEKQDAQTHDTTTPHIANQTDGTPTKTPNTPTARKTDDHPHTATVNEVKNADMRVHLSALTDSESQNAQGKQKAHPRDKYLDINMPEIIEDHLLGALESTNPIQITAWDEVTTGKTLARPFGTEVHYIRNHQSIANDLMMAIKEITEAPNASVGKPAKDPKAQDPNRPPMAFLVHGISVNDVALLESRKVWASNDITFEIIPFPTARPPLLFTIKELATQDKDYIKDLVLDTWKDAVSQAFFGNIVNRFQTEQQEAITQEISNFVYLIQVRLVEMKKEKGREDPHFNIFANGELISDTNIWLKTCDFLRQRSYRSPTLGRGLVELNAFHCRLCHSKDHPKGLCPFPKLPGWKGKNGSTPPVPTCPNQPRHGRRSFPPDSTRENRYQPNSRNGGRHPY